VSRARPTVYLSRFSEEEACFDIRSKILPAPAAIGAQ
jgi:hypothetical protein